jgi:hypothetical protein
MNMPVDYAHRVGLSREELLAVVGGDAPPLFNPGDAEITRPNPLTTEPIGGKVLPIDNLPKPIFPKN